MKIFLDTAEIDEIRIAARWGVLDGVTTNPTLFARVGGSYDAVLRQICQITSPTLRSPALTSPPCRTRFCGR